MSLTKQIQNLKQDRNNFMDNENHKNTWNNFTKICFVGNCSCNYCFSFNGYISFIIF